jgi:hypothetical protein
MTGALFGSAGRTLSFTVSEARYITYLVRWSEITKIQPRLKGDKRQGFRLFLAVRQLAASRRLHRTSGYYLPNNAVALT